MRALNLSLNFTFEAKLAFVANYAYIFAIRAICETLKTRGKLNLNFTRSHAITYTNQSLLGLISKIRRTEHVYEYTGCPKKSGVLVWKYQF